MNKFSFKYYEKMLKVAIEHGFVISSFENYDSNVNKTIILRHDIDYTLKGIKEFAEIENNLGITSTYFLRVHSSNYNLYSEHSYSLINYLLKYNHEIGLHFDSTYFSMIFNLVPREVFEKEKKLLELIIDKKIKSISEHYDVGCNIFKIPKLEKIVDINSLGIDNYAYDKKYVLDMKYISDSNANWREGDILDNLNFNRLQVLTHPELWSDKLKFIDFLTHHNNE